MLSRFSLVKVLHLKFSTSFISSFGHDISACSVNVGSNNLGSDIPSTFLLFFSSVTTVFNPAPAQSWLDTVFYKDSDVFCANETEVSLESSAGRACDYTNLLLISSAKGEVIRATNCFNLQRNNVA